MPPSLAAFGLELAEGGGGLVYGYDTRAERTGITALLQAVRDAGLHLRDLRTEESTLEEIFVELVRDRP